MIWFEDFKLTIQRTCSSENERLSIFKTYLAGDARLVYEGFNADDFDSLDQAGEMMKQVFAIARDQQEWILHLRDMKKKDTENLRVFAYRTTRMVRQAFPHADENTCNTLSIDYFTRGLPEAINSYVIIRKPGTLDLAIKYAIIAEKQEPHNNTIALTNTKASTKQVNNISQPEAEPYRNDTINRFKQVTEEIKNLKTKNQELQSILNTIQQTQVEFCTTGIQRPIVSEKPVLGSNEKYDQLLSAIQTLKQSQQEHYVNQQKRHCYNCGKAGHLKNRCYQTDQRNCFNCGKRGHLSKDCYSNMGQKGIKSYENRDSLKEWGVNLKSRK